MGFYYQYSIYWLYLVIIAVTRRILQDVVSDHTGCYVSIDNYSTPVGLRRFNPKLKLGYVLVTLLVTSTMGWDGGIYQYVSCLTYKNSYFIEYIYIYNMYIIYII